MNKATLTYVCKGKQILDFRLIKKDRWKKIFHEGESELKRQEIVKRIMEVYEIKERQAGYWIKELQPVPGQKGWYKNPNVQSASSIDSCIIAENQIEE
jgi:hypothetical protein